MLNNICIMGRLTKDVDLRTTPSGVPVVTFTIANDSGRKDAAGEKITLFIRCTAWRQTAELATRYLGKGRLVAVSGELSKRSYTDKDGNNRETTEINVNTLTFCDNKKDGGEGGAPFTNGFIDANNEDLPF